MAATFGLYFKEMSQSEANDMRRLLNQVAASHGFTATRGATAGQGNAAELMQSIASGETATVLLADEERVNVIAWLNAQAEQIRESDYLLSTTLTSIARQLYAAVKRERGIEEAEMRGAYDDE